MLEIVSQSALNQPLMSQPSRFAAAPRTNTTSMRTTILCRWKRLPCGAVTAGSTSVIVFYLYQQAFTYFRMGYASAVGYVLFVIIFVLTLLQFKFFGKQVEA